MISSLLSCYKWYILFRTPNIQGPETLFVFAIWTSKGYEFLWGCWIYDAFCKHKTAQYFIRQTYLFINRPCGLSEPSRTRFVGVEGEVVFVIYLMHDVKEIEKHLIVFCKFINLCDDEKYEITVNSSLYIDFLTFARNSMDWSICPSLISRFKL